MAKKKPYEGDKKKENTPEVPEAAPEQLEELDARIDEDATTDSLVKTAKALAETVKKLEDAEKRAEEAEKKCAELEEASAADKDKYLRLAAEYDNFRKRSQKEREGVYNDAVSDTVAKLLPVYDNLARALEHGTEDKAFLKGVEMTMTQLNGIFEKLGVAPIEAVGQPFDASRHEAVMHTEDESAGENTVVQEFEKGFTLGDKVIRYSKVVVAN